MSDEINSGNEIAEQQAETGQKEAMSYAEVEQSQSNIEQLQENKDDNTQESLDETEENLDDLKEDSSQDEADGVEADKDNIDNLQVESTETLPENESVSEENIDTLNETADSEENGETDDEECGEDLDSLQEDIEEDDIEDVEEYEDLDRLQESEDPVEDAEDTDVQEETEDQVEDIEDTEEQAETAETGLADTNIERSYESENYEVADKVREITSDYYDQAGELARNNEMGRAFTDHKEDHVEMVADKSLEAGDAIKNAVIEGKLGTVTSEERVSFSSDIDKKTLEGAALSHDTGMSGNGYALTPTLGEDGKQIKDENGKKMYEKDEEGHYVIHPVSNTDFSEVRENHSLNSAINVLANRAEYKEAGYTDEQVDKMAAECMAHSKSSSGVADLNSKEDWSDCFDRIESTVDAYNTDHPENHITFDRTYFEGNDAKLESLASETLALRVGDVSRDSFAGAEAQSGEAVHIDRATIDNHAGSVEGELKNADITIGELGKQIENDKSRQVHVGEQNITDNHSFVGSDGLFTHEITISDGASAPKCTQEALGDHLGELASAKDGEFDVNIEFSEPCDDFAIESYEQFRDGAAGKYENVNIHYPWDEEVW